MLVFFSLQGSLSWAGLLWMTFLSMEAKWPYLTLGFCIEIRNKLGTSTVAYPRQTIFHWYQRVSKKSMKNNEDTKEFTSSGQEHMINRWIVIQATSSWAGYLTKEQTIFPMSEEEGGSPFPQMVGYGNPPPILVWMMTGGSPSHQEPTQSANPQLGVPTWRRFEKLSEHPPALWPSSGSWPQERC